ncbi:hypothetical protein [Candidatus Sodalis pierantonius]|uniref:hypothetical protein n=1 Tax=Candidatus Sodalis pierantonii TaxID=1486991 RepID=UPI00138AE327|nr:hypothetical protein [Candidatus Sodalis pierantonius]
MTEGLNRVSLRLFSATIEHRLQRRVLEYRNDACKVNHSNKRPAMPGVRKTVFVAAQGNTVATMNPEFQAMIALTH